LKKILFIVVFVLGCRELPYLGKTSSYFKNYEGSCLIIDEVNTSSRSTISYLLKCKGDVKQVVFASIWVFPDFRKYNKPDKDCFVYKNNWSCGVFKSPYIGDSVFKEKDSIFFYYNDKRLYMEVPDSNLFLK
jgi:hypothetical protein